MLIPIYVLIGVWGGPARVKATVTFVLYTMVGSLLMLASIVAFGITQGHVPPGGDRDERQQLGVPRLPRRVRGEGAAAAVPRLAAHRVHRGAARAGGDPLGRRLEGRGLRARLDRAAALPGARRRLPRGRARPRRRDARLRLGARVPPARRPRRHRVLVDGPDGPHRARDLRRHGPRARRGRAALGQPRPRLRRAVPPRGDDRDAHRNGALRRAGRHGKGPPDPRDPRDDARDVRAGRPRLGELRGRVRDPRRRVRPRLGVRGGRRGRDRARRPLRAAAHLRDPPRAARERRPARTPATS